MDGVERRGDVRRQLERRRVVDGAFRAERPESIAVVSCQPCRHPAAVRAAEHADPAGVAELVAVECGVDDRQHVLDVDGAPTGTGHGRMTRALDRLTPPGVPSAAAARIAEHDDEAGIGLHLELVEEVLAVLCVRASMDVEQHRIPLRLVEVGRPHDPGVDLVGSVARAGGEAFPGMQCGGECVAHVGSAFVLDVQLCRLGRRLLRAGDHAAGDIEGGDRHGPVGQRLRHERTVSGQPEEVGGSAVFGGGEQLCVRLPHRATEPTVGWKVRSKPAETHRMSV